MRFFYDNLIDADGVAFAASSEQSNLPATNLADEHRGKVWRTGSSTAAESVVIDFGSAQSVTACIVFAHTLLGTDSAIAIEANTSDSWGAPAFSQSLTWAAGAIAATFASQSYRYWRLKFTKASAGVTRDVGRIFLGTYTDVTEDFDWGGFSQGRKDTSVSYRSIGGQTFADVREQFRTISGNASAITQASSDSLETIGVAVGTATPFWVRLNTSDAVTLPTGEYLYVKFSSLKGRKATSYDGAYYWDVTLEMEEQL